MNQINIDNIELEDVDNFYRWLQGENVDVGIESVAQPTLTKEEAFSTIYYLQEVLHILPDRHERCVKCGCLFDSDSEGTCIDTDSAYIHHDPITGDETEAKFAEDQYGNYCGDCDPYL